MSDLIKVFSLDPLTVVADSANCFYWQDTVAMRSCGPFTTIFQCVEHYKTWAKIESPTLLPNEEDMKNVIQVDFINKRRLG